MKADSSNQQRRPWAKFPVRLNQRALVKFIESNFECVKGRSTLTELTFICPSCKDSSGHRSVNLTNFKTNCFICGDGGHILGWLKRHGYEVDADSLCVEASGDDESLLKGMRNTLQEIMYPSKPRFSPGSATTLPEGFVSLYDAMQQGKWASWVQEARRMAESKHLELEDFVNAGVGFVPASIQSPWFPYLITPVVMWGKVVYYQGRAWIKADTGWEGVTDKKFPSRDVQRYGSAQWLYNFDEALDPVARQIMGDEAPRPDIHQVIIVESILNVLSLRKKFAQEGITDVVPMATFSSALSERQEHWLHVPKHISEFCMFFDRDATGKAWKVADRLARTARSGTTITVAEMPDVAGPTSDPNDDVDVAFKAWEVRQRCQPGSGDELVRKLKALMA